MSDHGSSSLYVPKITEPRRTIGGQKIDFDRQIVVMGIVNRTPDSFHDQGRTFELTKALDAALSAEHDGADWIDIGGVPFGLHAGEITEHEEIDRVVPLIERIRETSRVVISVDTYRPRVARLAIAAGANIVNDTSGLFDLALADTAAGTGATLIITHSLARPPRTPVIKPAYDDVVAEVAEFLSGRVAMAQNRGVADSQIIIDPGPDLNKNTRHSLELVRRLSEIAEVGFPLLAALSNKDFIGETLDASRDHRLEGTIATNVVAVLRGARILRVHDVKAAVATARMVEAIYGWRPPAYIRHNVE